MNDNIIINMISKTYFAIVSLFIFIFLLLFIGFITLQNGLFINKVSFANIHIEQLYIKWNEKLDVSVHEINISQDKSSNESKTEVNYNELGNFLRSLSRTSHWFNSLVIEKILYKKIIASFKYNNNEQGFFLASSNTMKFDAILSKEEDLLNIQIKKFFDKQRNIEVFGNIYLDIKNIQLYTNLHINISKELDLTLYLQSNTESLIYKFNSNKKILDYKHALSLVNLPKETIYWAYDAIKMSSVNVTSAYGYINYNKLDNILQDIHISATIDKLQYRYNKNLDAIHSKETQLEFKNGALFIYPHQAYTSGKYLGESWLKLDFTKKEEMLTINLLFDTILDNDMLKILNTYKIKLPFLQKKGTIKTDLSLVIGLRELHVKAKGNFYTQKANFDYLGMNIDIYNANIFLDNYDVIVKNMQASYKQIAKALVDVTYNAETSQGDIAFHFTKIETKGVSLNTKTSPLYVKYNIREKQDYIDVNTSQWQIYDKTINVDSLHIPFNLEELKLQVPTTFIENIDIGSAFISGWIDLNNFTGKFDADILKFNYEGVHFSQSNTPFKISYDKKLSITSNNEIFFTVSGSNYKASDFYLEINDEKILLKHTKLNIGKYITTKIYANFNPLTNKSHISLNNFILTDPNTHNILYKNKKIMLSLTHVNNILKINSPELTAEFSSQEKGWKLKLTSLGRIAKNSSLLKKLHIENGNFTLYKNKNDKYTRFKSDIVYPYKLLVENNIPLKDYKIKGKIYKEKVDLYINRKIHIVVKDSININMDYTSININALLDIIKDLPAGTGNAKTLNILLKAKNSNLYIDKDRHALYDTLDMQFYKNILTAQLKHEKGYAGLRLENNKFHLYGKEFNDKFMNKLFSLAKFSKGNLDFSLSGDISDYSGVIYIKKTTIKDYKILNNILAFVNTVPSLVTFQLPGYNKEGLFVDTAYANFKYKKNVFHFSDLYLDSKEIDIFGKGVADVKNDKIDIVLNLKTDLGSDLAKVPLVGYIILDKDAISTTLNIKGKFSDPEVNSLLAEEIIVAPLNIIKRTLSLPYILIRDAIDKK
ncbi:MAG: AsmA-like C-terminal domain-containing protein [Sulfurimonas sp.]|nr:AsmA-like C-terminal domain-containing protein [Sulfurimonas sp.]